MKTCLTLSLLLLTSFLLPAAGDSTFNYRGSAYAFATGGTCQHGYAVAGAGGGAEGFIWKGLSIGFEAGYQNFIDSYRYMELSMPIGYHFGNRKIAAKWDPFITTSLLGAGISIDRGDFGAAGSLGGGVNYWFRKRLGFRFEFRSHVLAGQEITAQGRVGIVFR